MPSNRPSLPLGIVEIAVDFQKEISIGDIFACLIRHAYHDWGEISDEQRLANEDALNLLKAFSPQSDDHRDVTSSYRLSPFTVRIHTPLSVVLREVGEPPSPIPA